MSLLFTRKSVSEEETNKNEDENKEIIKEKDGWEESNHQDIDECGIHDFYLSIPQKSILSSLRTSSDLFNSVNILLCHLQSPELMLYLSEDISRRDYQKFIGIVEKYQGVRSQIYFINASARNMLNKILSISKKNK